MLSEELGEVEMAWAVSESPHSGFVSARLVVLFEDGEEVARGVGAGVLPLEPLWVGGADVLSESCSCKTTELDGQVPFEFFSLTGETNLLGQMAIRPVEPAVTISVPLKL